MAYTNLIVGANAVVCRYANDVENVFDETEIDIVYEVGNPNKSYVPGRSINAFTAFVKGKGYYVIAKVPMNKAYFFVGPVGPAINFILVNDSDPAKLQMYFNKSLNESGNTGITNQITVTQNGTSKPLTAASAVYTDNVLTVTAASAFTAGATIVANFGSGAYHIFDLEGNTAEFFTNEPVLNNL